MFFRQRTNRDASISYFFGCAGHGKSVAVDVLAGDEQWYLEEARRTEAPLVMVVDTHVHADHRSGGRELARLAGVPYGLHAAASGMVRFDFHPLEDGDVIDVGNVFVSVLHTPGHTQESICLLVTDRRRGDAPWFVTTGDTLFVGSVGRPDLAGREREMAGALYQSLQAKLLSLPGEVEIYPGHQAGSTCGIGLSGKPSSTIAFEKRWNPVLTMSREDFIHAVTAEIPPRPDDMDAFIAFNRGVAA